MKYPRKVDYLRDRTGGVKIWEEYWQEQDLAKQIEELKKDEVAPIMRKWIVNTTNKKGDQIILDGGCGNCRYLMYFGGLGYEVVGVDFNERATNLAKYFNSSLKVLRANVLALPFRSESFDYYISLGVLEHFVEGPEEGLKEAHRVLKKHGVLFFSVPYINNLRILEQHLENLRKKFSDGQRKPEGVFYQYYFTKKELNAMLTSFGFEVLKEYPLNQELGLLRAMLFVRKNRILNYLTINLAKVIKRFLPWFSPHMVLLICKKGDLDLHDG